MDGFGREDLELESKQSFAYQKVHGLNWLQLEEPDKQGVCNSIVLEC